MMQGEDSATTQAVGGWAGSQWVEHYGAGALIATVAGKRIQDVTPAEYRAINSRATDAALWSQYSL